MLHIIFFFNDTATTEIYTLSLHDALPISTVDRYQDKILTAREYKELNEECKKYGKENYGELVESDKYSIITRIYEYSIPLDTCVAEIHYSADLGRFGVFSLSDIYQRETLYRYSFNEEEDCKKRYEDDPETLLEKCKDKNDYLNKRAEIFEKQL